MQNKTEKVKTKEGGVKRRMKNFSRNKGITLIALVITIIVLLILAAVSIATLTGDNGILTRTREVAKSTDLAEVKERAEIVKSGMQIDSYSKGGNRKIQKEKLLDELQKEFEESTRNGSVVTTKNNKYDILVDNELNITVVEHNGDNTSSENGITLTYTLKDEGTGIVHLNVFPIINSIGEIPSYEEYVKKCLNEILPTDSEERKEELNRIFIEKEKNKASVSGYNEEINNILDVWKYWVWNRKIDEEYTYTNVQEYYEAKEAYIYDSIEEYFIILDYISIDESKYYEKYGKSVTIACSNNESKTINLLEDGYVTFTIRKNGTYKVTAEDEEENTGEIKNIKIATVEEEKFSRIYDKKTSITTKDNKNITIPAGFAVGISEKIDEVSEGLVITDAVDEEGYSIGNEFVWVPVPDEVNFIRKSGYQDGSRQDAGDLSNYTEPYSGGYINEEKEYNAMKTSVINNKGFYIGRYEAGIEGGTLDISENWIEWIGGKLVIKAGIQPYNHISWGRDADDETGGAVEKAKGLASQEGYEGVTSTLIYGIQWDATMQFFDENYITGECKEDSYVRNSTGKGNYGSSELTNTGIYAEKNIYDMGGNLWELTMEAYDDNQRICRGGYYDYEDGAEYPASSRECYWLRNESRETGFRIVLYL